MSTIGFTSHDHATCVSSAMRAAETMCRERGLRLTPVRRRTLEILLAEHRALGAYDVLALLSKEGLGSQPPVAYRALSFLVDAGFAHKIEALNAYIACTHQGAPHTPAFLICKTCNAVAETAGGSMQGVLSDAATAAGFAIDRTVVEAEGICPKCQE